MVRMFIRLGSRVVIVLGGGVIYAACLESLVLDVQG
jgi:hypothetical protein